MVNVPVRWRPLQDSNTPLHVRDAQGAAPLAPGVLPGPPLLRPIENDIIKIPSLFPHEHLKKVGVPINAKIFQFSPIKPSADAKARPPFETAFCLSQYSFPTTQTRTLFPNSLDDNPRRIA